MNGYGLTAAIFQAVTSLAWPVAFVVAVWLFREELTRLLPNLRIKYKDMEASFLRLNNAEKEAANLPPPPANAETEPTPEEKSKFAEMAKYFPRAAILEARANLEEAVRSFGQEVGISNISAYMNYAGLIRTLRKNELIDANTSALLDDLRAIGNAAAHNQSSPTERDALRYQSLADRLIAQLGIATGAAQMPPPGPITPRP